MGACCERGAVDKLVNDVGMYAVKGGGENGVGVLWGWGAEACSKKEGPGGQWRKLALKGAWGSVAEACSEREGPLMEVSSKGGGGGGCLLYTSPSPRDA